MNVRIDAVSQDRSLLTSYRGNPQPLIVSTSLLPSKRYLFP